jgi:riboflavin kinase/FMN adenylyltransferase
MEPSSRLDGIASARFPKRPLHLAIGMFDGVHLGHRAVVESAVQSARGEGGLAAVLTFWPHPSAVLRPGHATPLLQDAETKAALLLGLGVDSVITQGFDPALAALEASEFLPWLRLHLPGLVAVHVGENFRFGRGREGDVASLVGEGRRLGVHVFSTARVNLDGEPISSTAIRSLLAKGDIAAVNARLGGPYLSRGRVLGGKRLGRTIGFPTLNLAWAPAAAPRFGVYAVRVAGSGPAAPQAAVANYGLRPTVENAVDPRLEVHVLGDCPWGEGDQLTVEWMAFLRPERRFADVMELSAQIARDRDAAAAFFVHDDSTTDR